MIRWFFGLFSKKIRLENERAAVFRECLLEAAIEWDETESLPPYLRDVKSMSYSQLEEAWVQYLEKAK